jgi:hypothetical protein
LGDDNGTYLDNLLKLGDMQHSHCYTLKNWAMYLHSVKFCGILGALIEKMPPKSTSFFMFHSLMRRGFFGPQVITQESDV